ncbi:MAG TPA: hypothetical protein VF044_04130 [Actinomycetota bacterium]
MRIGGTALVLSALVLAACADEAPAGTGAGSDAPSADGRYEAVGLVLERPGEAPALCLGGVADSYPPQCSGIPLAGWTWDAVDDETRASGTIWGDAHVVGTYDGATFTVEEAGPPRPASDPGVDFTPPCPEPAGGWVVPDPTRATEGDRAATVAAAEAEPDHAATWISYLDEAPADPEDPGPYVLVLGFTGDLERHRADAEATWGGPLCVFEQTHAHRELVSIQRDVEDALAGAGAELLWSGIDVTRNRVDVGVVVATPELERTLAERFGDGAVHLEPALRPVG